LALPETSLPNYNGDFNNNYFKIENNLGLGSAFLVGQSQFKLPNVVKELCKDEVEMHHNIAGYLTFKRKETRETLANEVAYYWG